MNKTFFQSVLQWISSFLIIDLLFWGFVLLICTSDSISCFESIFFGVAFFYISWIWAAFVSSTPHLIICGMLSHVVIGTVFGWLLRRKQISWVFSIIIALAVILIPVILMARWQQRQELTRETTTQLWLVDHASASEIQFRRAQLANGTLKVEDGSSSFNVAAFDTRYTEVELLNCQQSNCSETVAISYVDYLAAKTACHQDEVTCPYYNIGNLPTLFEVTSNPKEIISMRQIYQGQSVPLLK